MAYSQHAYRVPGVYIERADASRVPPVVLRTDVAAFVGIAEQGPLDTPVPIESVRQFASHFGGFIGSGYLAYAARAFFENGGRRCWVVRVAARDFTGTAPATTGARPAWIDIRDVDGNPALRVSASSAGSWGNGLTLEWSPSGATLATSVPARTTREYAGVTSAAGFAVDDLVRIEQPARPPQYRVIAAVDIGESTLYWMHPDAARRRPTDEPLLAFDPIVPLRIVRVAYALAVRRDGVIVAQYRDLHLTRTHPRCIGTVLRPVVYWSSVLRGSALEGDAGEAARDGEPAAMLPRAPEPIIAESLAQLAIPRPLDVPFDAAQRLQDGADGLAALTTRDFIGEPVSPNDSDFAQAVKSRGIRSLAPIDEIALVAVPDILIRPEGDPEYRPVPPLPLPCAPCPPPAPPRTVHQPRQPGELPPVFSNDDIGRVQAALVEACDEAGDRIALLALPWSLATPTTAPREDIIGWRERFDARIAALYAPWVEVAEPRGTAITRVVPPCGHVAGAIARVDLAAGVQRAPANVTLSGVVRLVRAIDDALHGALNDANVNALRTEFGQPCRIGGARSLAFDIQWRYLNVVRLMLTIKKAADIALRFTVFEPNEITLWANVRAALMAILQLFFERGAFAGGTPDESFYVRCDETTNPPQAREAGQLLALIGFQPAAPCEFIVVRVGRQFAAPAVSLFAADEVPA